MTSVADRADVVVVGSGICGAIAAGSLARRGLSVLVVDKEPRAAAEASGQAQGILRLQGRDAPELPLAQEALELWREARAEAGADLELAFDGNLYLAQDENELAELHALVSEAHALGLRDIVVLSPSEVRELLPAAREYVLGAMWSPRDGQCEPRAATDFFVSRARRAGAEFAYCVKATRILVREGRVSGLQLATSRIACERIVVAGGVWTPHLLSTVGLRVPIMPVWLSEGETSPAPDLIRGGVRAVGFGGRQRPNGRIVFSAGLNARVSHGLSLYDGLYARKWIRRFTAHRSNIKLSVDWSALRAQARHRSLAGTETVPVGRRPRPDTRQVHAAHRAMGRIFPDVALTRVERVWAGRIDMSLDGRPIIESSAGPEGLVFVAGLSGHGLALAPVIGEITADLVTTGTTERPIHPFRLSRFQEEAVPIPRKTL